MSVQVQIDYRLLAGSPGWAACSIRQGDQSLAMPSFSGALTDPLGDLLRATLQIVTGAHQAHFSFCDEPAPWWTWRLEQRPLANPLRGELDVVVFRLNAPGADTGEIVLRLSCEPDAFAEAVVRAARAVLDTHGADGFLAHWGGPFPTRALVAMEAALSVKQATPLAVDPRHWR